MNYLACSLAIAVTSVVLGGCSSGEDVYIESSSALSSSICEIPLTDGSCGGAANVPGATPALTKFLNTNLALEAQGDGDLRNVHYFCSDILHRLGVGPEPLTPGDPRGRTPNEAEAIAICRLARFEIDHRRSSSFELAFGGIECSSEPPPCEPKPVLVDQGDLYGMSCNYSWLALSRERFASDRDYELAQTIEQPLTGLGVLAESLDRWHGWTTQALAAVEAEKGNVSAGHECMVSQAVWKSRIASSKHKLAIRLAGEVLAGITAIGP